jgi:hypothetical protein
MTSLEVINTDAFLDMPQSSQLLYFHLNARADDDGFVSNPKSIMRNCGAQGDDIKLLIAKKFLINFEDGVCVIKHWRINNYIRKDIYSETKYLNHKQILFIRPNGAYTLTDDGRAVCVPRGHFQLEDIKPKLLKKGSTKARKHVDEPSTERALRLGKVRLGKVSINKDISEQSSQVFDWNNYLKGMDDNKRVDIQLIGYFFRRRGLSFSSKAEAEIAIRRHLRAAKSLVPFEKKKVFKGMDECDVLEKQKGIRWSLETVLKMVTK